MTHDPFQNYTTWGTNPYTTQQNPTAAFHPLGSPFGIPPTAFGQGGQGYGNIGSYGQGVGIPPQLIPALLGSQIGNPMIGQQQYGQQQTQQYGQQQNPLLTAVLQNPLLLATLQNPLLTATLQHQGIGNPLMNPLVGQQGIYGGMQSPYQQHSLYQQQSPFQQFGQQNPFQQFGQQGYNPLQQYGQQQFNPLQQYGQQQFNPLQQYGQQLAPQSWVGGGGSPYAQHLLSQLGRTPWGGGF